MNLKLIFLFAIIASLGFATSGSGTIQACLSNGWDYCTINTSSMINQTDFSISNKGVNISTGVTVSLNASRLNITTTEYINVFGVINGSGMDANQSYTSPRAGDGGTGGSSCYAFHSSCTVNGSMNGANGIDGYAGGVFGNGSKVMPFEYTAGTNGTSTYEGGGFYATGFCYGLNAAGSVWSNAGGSGHAIYLQSANITMNGSILANAGIPYNYGGSANHCGGSGGGEVILRANHISMTGNISATGSDAISGAGSIHTIGGDGGHIKICSATQPTVSGLMNVSGGAGVFSGADGADGSINNCFVWSVTFNCTDEMNNNTKNFTATILTGQGQILLSSPVFNYTMIPTTDPLELWNSSYDMAAEHPIGIYELCFNGTTRYYIAASTGSYNIRGYSLNQTLGSYYSFQVKNSLGAVVPNVQVSAYRYDTDLDAYAVIEQSITDSGGMATFYLQPLVPYQMVFIASGYVTMTYNFLPSTTSQIAIVLNPGGTNGTNGSNTTLPQPMPNYQFAYGDVSFNVEPSAGTYTNDTNVTYTVASAGGLLEYWGMTVTYVNGTNTTSVYTNNLTTTSGGTMNYTASAYGTYIVSVWFKEQNFSLYTPFPTSFNIINATDNSFFNTRQHFVTTHVVSDWVFYFIAVVISMLVAGFVSRYTYEGAAWVGLLVLWGFTIFMTPTLIPASGVIYTALMGGAGGTSIQITAWMATSLATIGVLATTYLMKAGL